MEEVTSPMVAAEKMRIKLLNDYRRIINDDKILKMSPSMRESAIAERFAVFVMSRATAAMEESNVTMGTIAIELVMNSQTR